MFSLIVHGRRSIIELQKCRNLRFSVNLLQNVSAFSNFFSSAYATDCRKGSSFTVSYLVDSLGLTTKLAESISRRVSFEDKGNPDSVLSLLTSHGFTDSQIFSVITNYPRLLIFDAEKSLGPKLKFLLSRGASTSELTEIVSKVPKILGKKEGKCISVYYDFVKEILQDEEEEEEGDAMVSTQGKQENIIRNVSVLRGIGVPQKLLFLLLNSHRFQIVDGKEKFEESLKKVVEMGFDPTTLKFLEALRIVYALKEKTMEEKFDVYERFGFTVGDIWAMFKKWPLSLTHSEKKITQKFEALKKCGLLQDEIRSVFSKFPQCIGTSEQKIGNSIETYLGLGFTRDEFAMMVKRFPPSLNLSAERVKKKTEYLVNKMNWPLKAVVSIPVVLGCSLEKRIVPRCNVINALMSKGLLGSELPPLSSVLVRTDEVFLNQYVRKHDDKELVAELMAMFTGKKRKSDKTHAAATPVRNVKGD